MDHSSTGWRRITWAGRILNIVVVLGLVVFAFGLALGWFSLSVNDADTATDDRFSITLTVNKDEVADSAHEAKNEVVGLKDVVVEASKLETIDGTVTDVDPSTSRVTVAPDGQSDEQVLVRIDEQTDFSLDDDHTGLDGLSASDEVSITYVETDNGKLAKRISDL